MKLKLMAEVHTGCPSYNYLLCKWNYWTLWMHFPRLIVFEALERYLAFVLWCNFVAQQILSAWFCSPKVIGILPWDHVRLGAVMKLLCAYLNMFLIRLLEVNSALVIWCKGTGCAQYHNSNIQSRSQSDVPLSLESYPYRSSHLLFSFAGCYIITNLNEYVTYTSLQITLAGPKITLFFDGRITNCIYL